jgi:hypothetical protein
LISNKGICSYKVKETKIKKKEASPQPLSRGEGTGRLKRRYALHKRWSFVLIAEIRNNVDMEDAMPGYV